MCPNNFLLCVVRCIWDKLTFITMEVGRIQDVDDVTNWQIQCSRFCNTTQRETGWGQDINTAEGIRSAVLKAREAGGASPCHLGCNRTGYNQDNPLTISFSAPNGSVTKTWLFTCPFKRYPVEQIFSVFIYCPYIGTCHMMAYVRDHILVQPFFNTILCINALNIDD